MRSFFRKKAVKAVALVLLSLTLVYAVFQSGTFIMGAVKKPWTPDYEYENIYELLKKDELSDEDYATIYRQTGLSEIGVRRLIEQGRAQHILTVQEDFFDKSEPRYDIFSAVVGAFERESGHYSYTALEDGDIVCCLSTYLSFFHIGHCGIVVDGTFQILAESEGYGSVMETVSAANFFTASSFVILRVKTDAATRAQVVDYVMNEMLGAKYDFFVGIFEPKALDPLRRTHCSHAVWYAYNKFGIDLDSNGGKIVSPLQIARSPYVEIVQIRGVDPQLLEKQMSLP